MSLPQTTVSDKKRGFKNLKKRLSQFVRDISTQEVATITNDSFTAYTNISLDGDAIAYVNNDLQNEELYSIQLHNHMIMVSRISKNAFGEMLNELV